MTELLTDEHIAHDLALAERYEKFGAEWFDPDLFTADNYQDVAQRGYGAALREVQQWRREATPEKHHAECDTCFDREVEVQRLREALGNTRTIAKQHSKGGPLAGSYQWFMQEIDKALEGGKE